MRKRQQVIESIETLLRIHKDSGTLRYRELFEEALELLKK